MATVAKIVRFYDTVLIDDAGVRLRPPTGFWSGLLTAFAGWDLPARSGRIGDVDYFARAVSPVRPALPHLQVERIRDLVEQLNRSNLGNGDVTPLDFDDPNDRVSEPTFIVPFGQHGRVAVMSPAVQATRPETLSRWLTLVLDLTVAGYSLEFMPVIDPEMLAKITSAEGAVMLEVHVDREAEIPDGGGVVGDAFRSAQQNSLEETTLVMRWSLDRAGGTAGVRTALRDGARWVINHTFAKSAKVKLVTEDASGKLVRDQIRNLFEDRITKSITFTAVAGQRTSDEVILGAIGQAIRDFAGGGRSTAPAGVDGRAQLTIPVELDGGQA